jgi:hypothetical protein
MVNTSFGTAPGTQSQPAATPPWHTITLTGLFVPDAVMPGLFYFDEVDKLVKQTR